VIQLEGEEKRLHFLMDSDLRHKAHRYALFNTGDEQGEPNDDIGSSARLDEGDFRWSREDVALMLFIFHVMHNIQKIQLDLNNHESRNACDKTPKT
ncbi:hypothetical protein H5410_002538, partial [Solanum commersonii]